jgi:hypothetical protein
MLPMVNFIRVRYAAMQVAEKLDFVKGLAATPAGSTHAPSGTQKANG